MQPASSASPCSEPACPVALAPDPAPHGFTLQWLGVYAFLAAATLLVHGFHPFSEDGGLYAAGVEYTLDPRLFPHFTAFVTAPLRYSLFAPTVSALLRLTRLPLSGLLLLLDLASAVFTFAAAHALLRRCIAGRRAQLAGLALFAAGWTLPVAGTSLLLMDPYLTARSVSMPLSLAALAFALDPWPAFALSRSALHHPAALCAASLLLATAFHPLMAFYALVFVAALRCTVVRRPALAGACLAAPALLACLLLRRFAPPDSPASTAAAVSRYYWFLSRWHWYELLGLLGPLLILTLLATTLFPSPGLRTAPLRNLAPGDLRSTAFRRLCVSAILLGSLAVVCALLFAPEAAANHALARLQPLRLFLPIYALMLLLLGAALFTWAFHAAAATPLPAKQRLLACVAPLFTLAMAGGLYAAARSTYPASPHIELPAREGTRNPNPWVLAFLWARDHTPPDALFALDARYVNQRGEDAQTFRAISLRSALPDFSKDGGEASITPALAPAWLAASAAQADLTSLSPVGRTRRLAPYPVTWLILAANAPTDICPYQNAVVKVCPVPITTDPARGAHAR